MCKVQNLERCGGWGDQSEGVWTIGAEGGRSGLAGVLIERPGLWGLGFTLHTQPGPAGELQQEREAGGWERGVCRGGPG